jgi:hypothetical protein
MIKKILKTILPTIVSTSILFTIGVIIWFFTKKYQLTFLVTLFFVGAFPVVFLGIGAMGSMGRTGDLGSGSALSGTVGRVSQLKKSRQDFNDNNLYALSKSNIIILAGILIMLISFLM